MTTPLTLPISVKLPSSSRTTCLSSQGPYAVSGHDDGSIEIYEFTGKSLQRRIHIKASKSRIQDICILRVPSDDQTGLALHIISVNSDGIFSKFNLMDGRCLGHSNVPLYDSTPFRLREIRPPSFNTTGKSTSLGLEEDPLANRYVMCSGASTEIAIVNICSLELATLWGSHNEWILPTQMLHRNDHEIIGGNLITITSEGYVSLWDFDHAVSRIRKDLKKVDITGKITCVEGGLNEIFISSNREIIGFTVKNESVIPLVCIQRANTLDLCIRNGELFAWDARGSISRYRLFHAPEKDDIEHFGYREDIIQIVEPIKEGSSLGLVTICEFNGDICAVYFNSHGIEKYICVFNDDSICNWEKITEKNKDDSTMSCFINKKNVYMGMSEGLKTTTLYNLLMGNEEQFQPITSTSTTFISALTKSHIITGDINGTINIYKDMKITQTISAHIMPVIGTLGPFIDAGPHLSQLFFIISKDNSLSAYSITSCTYQFHMIGSESSIECAFYKFNEDTLVLSYTDGSLRIWEMNILDQQLNGQIAMNYLNQYQWNRISIKKQSQIQTSSRDTVYFDGNIATVNIKHLLHTINYGHFNEEGLNETERVDNNQIDNDRWSIAESRLDLPTIKSILSCILSWNLDEKIDNIVENHLGIKKCSQDIHIGIMGANNVTSIIINENSNSSKNIWNISSTISAHLLLCIISLSRSFLSIRGFESYANQLITFYSTNLMNFNSNFKKPSLSYLVKFWQDPVSDVQQTARMLISSTLDTFSPKEINSIIRYWRNFLPAVSPLDLYTSQYMARSAIILGIIGSDKSNLLSSEIAREVALSLTLLLNDNKISTYQLIAIDLCGRGFTTWQNYFNAAEVLRTLIQITVDKSSNIISTASRSAIIQIASLNTPLFITTIVSDIMNDRNPETRNGCMKLVTLIVRKKPLIFYANLPRLVEAIVKSLDPNISHVRETVMSTASAILHNLVITYPIIDFHPKSQRLVVGTFEGAIIIYDLRTATRLNILEGHKTPVSAVSFSPDAKYVVSVAMDEKRVLAWRIYTGLLSAFTSNPTCKQYDFNLASNEGDMTIASMMEWIKFEWPTDRTVRLKIRETTLTFPV